MPAHDDVRVRIARHLPASAERIFDAWLRAEWLSRWMFGPAVRDERILELRLDPRVEGRFLFRVERDGAVIDHGGQYLRIDRPQALSFTWGAWGEGEHPNDDSRVEITIAPAGEGCTLSLEHAMSRAWADYATRTEQGWSRMLDALAAALGDGGNDGHGAQPTPDAIRFERLLPGPIERVWAHLVDPGKRALWLAGGPMTLASGGDVELAFRNAELSRGDDPAPEKYRDYENSGEVFGQVTACDPPRLLAFTWSDMPGEPEAEDSEVRFELSPHGDRVRLVLTHTRLLSHEILSVAGGWHTHLGILDDILSERETRPFWRTHTRLEAEYAERLGIEG